MNDRKPEQEDRELMSRIASRYYVAKNKNPSTNFEALVSEVGELGIEINKLRTNLAKEVPDKFYENRIVDEAIDVIVIAVRIAKGEIF